jgi:hypothetical protein
LGTNDTQYLTSRFAINNLIPNETDLVPLPDPPITGIPDAYALVTANWYEVDVNETGFGLIQTWDSMQKNQLIPQDEPLTNPKIDISPDGSQWYPPTIYLEGYEPSHALRDIHVTYTISWHVLYDGEEADTLASESLDVTVTPVIDQNQFSLTKPWLRNGTNAVGGFQGLMTLNATFIAGPELKGSPRALQNITGVDNLLQTPAPAAIIMSNGTTYRYDRLPPPPFPGTTNLGPNTNFPFLDKLADPPAPTYYDPYYDVFQDNGEPTYSPDHFWTIGIQDNPGILASPGNIAITNVGYDIRNFYTWLIWEDNRPGVQPTMYPLGYWGPWYMTFWLWPDNHGNLNTGASDAGPANPVFTYTHAAPQQVLPSIFNNAVQFQ